MEAKVCIEPECEGPSRARGYCTKHYQQWRKRTPEADRALPTSEELFWAKVDRSGGPDSCWHWGGTLSPDTGYGQVRVAYRSRRAHRYAYELSLGPIPAGLVIDHTCHNSAECTDVPCLHRRCVNPSHLEAVTQSVNTSRGRTGHHHSMKTHCPQGHEYNEKNTAPQYNGRGRRCRACANARSIARNARKKAA
jgi:hypothetical protein